MNGGCWKCAATPNGSGHSAKTRISASLANSCSTNTSAFAINNALTARGMLDRRREAMRAYDSDMSLLPDVDSHPSDARCLDAVADALSTHGACRMPGFPGTAASAALRADLVGLRE